MKPFKLKRPNIKTRTVFSIFFWLFNLSLLLVILVGFVPFIGIAILSDALRGEVPISILVPVFGLVGVPTTSTVMGIQRQRRLNATHRLQSQGKGAPHPTHQPISLVQLFFGIEAPLLMACTIRLFFLRDLTPASAFIFTSIALGTLAFSHWLLTDRHREPSATSWLHLAGLTTMLLLSLYLSAIALFYAIPIIQTVIIGIFYSFLLIVLLPIFFPLIMLLSGLTIMPWGMLVLFLRSWRQTLNALSTRYGTARPRAVIGGVLAVWLGLIVILQQQPQAQAFALLEQHPQSEGDRLALLEKSDIIRRGLLNAYLGAYRYPLLSNRGMYNTYRHYIGFPESTSEQLQAAYNTVLSPFAYQGTELDKEKAAQLYAEFFDTPILRGEHDAIQTAVLSNFNRSEAKAGLLDINAERVALRQQDVTVTPQGDWAAIELHEEYANTTFDDTEILYYFSLPESATLTGLWLGETGDRAQRYEYVVAPRGAAQEVYNEQVRRRIDPALLEQVGPRNYRLRAFPIPPAGQDMLPEDGEPDTMHLWMTYNVMKQNDQWMLPVLNEQRNIFWTENTKRTINGKHERGNTEWLPVSIPADASEPTAHQVEFSEGYIVAQPLDANDYQLPENQRFALILDRSYSMAAHRKDVENSIQWLKDNVLESNTFDLYLTDVDATQAEKISTLDTFDPKSIVYYGTMQTRQLLEQYQQAIAPTSQNAESPDAESPDAESPDYDAIILLTDSGSYELTHDGSPVELSAPLWLVHLGGLQAAYDDATLETIQNTGGNTTDNLETAMTRIATQPSLGDGTSLLNVVDGYAWFLRQTPDPTATTTDTMAPMAARQWIAQVSEAVKPDQLHQLDAIHQVAKDTSIVTPYSSMLVLVNTQQEEQLKEAESRSDRFDREIEDQQLPEPQDAIAPVSAVPEPAEWLLLMACVALLGGWYWQKESTTPYED
ncbi:MAG: TIGR02921 family PEP-CTERM protein, partial [Cyanobacteria bacterium P01_A01_bin.37]